MEERKFIILKWPYASDIVNKPDLSKAYPLLREFQVCVCLDIDGTRAYFYHNEVKEVTNE